MSVVRPPASPLDPGSGRAAPEPALDESNPASHARRSARSVVIGRIAGFVLEPAAQAIEIVTSPFASETRDYQAVGLMSGPRRQPDHAVSAYYRGSERMVARAVLDGHTDFRRPDSGSGLRAGGLRRYARRRCDGRADVGKEVLRDHRATGRAGALAFSPSPLRPGGSAHHRAWRRRRARAGRAGSRAAKHDRLSAAGADRDGLRRPFAEQDDGRRGDRHLARPGRLAATARRPPRPGAGCAAGRARGRRGRCGPCGVWRALGQRGALRRTNGQDQRFALCDGTGAARSPQQRGAGRSISPGGRGRRWPRAHHFRIECR